MSSERSFDRFGLTTQENTFLDSINKEVTRFNEIESGRCVLILPAFRSRLRYLAHNYIQEKHKCYTFSIGPPDLRFLVVCHHHLNLPPSEEQEKKCATMDSTENKGAVTKRRQRPDAPIYVPPAQRLASDAQRKVRATKSKTNGTSTSTNSASVPVKTVIEANASHEIKTNKKTDEKHNSKILSHKDDNDNVVSKNVEYDVCKYIKDILIKTDEKKGDEPDEKKPDAIVPDNVEKWSKKEEREESFIESKEDINVRTKRILKQNSNSDVLIIANPKSPETPKAESLNNSQNRDVESWEDLFDDEGQLNPEYFSDIKERIGEVTVIKPEDNFTEFRKKSINIDTDLNHVVEIYEFPAEFKTQDIMSIFESQFNGQYHIKWVDDNHALAVLSSETAAKELLKIQHPMLKVRPMSEASRQSINKAKRYPNAMMPFAVRPQTCPQAARRMVSIALGLKMKNAKEEREKERQILKEAREKKKLAAKQQDDAWEGRRPS